MTDNGSGTQNQSWQEAQKGVKKNKFDIDQKYHEDMIIHKRALEEEERKEMQKSERWWESQLPNLHGIPAIITCKKKLSIKIQHWTKN